MGPVESEADRASFFNEDEFAQIATMRGEPIAGYFSEQSEILDGLGEVQVVTVDPTFQCQSSELPGDLIEGEPITIARDDGTTFTGKVVNPIEPDGFGLTLLNLEET